ncbi:hypothetical protein CGCSCA4_v013440 [Colletotrichum siamense]|uniref:Uncharacterized protein n=1 Tax=Colletotrichum siamense TaxID=690259 RepID=A0A9P5ENW7_COLSI|nr:hypothetical protein CGCTS75_v006455 [Colletotrichum tropicale]KAF4833081.1 hypothetical protein CGCSCA4_v013440 [Colletotrichum siamense]KAF4855710.1 hypothetical protein CGCSCA2_v008804 [Colletotrichum siamense]KAF4918584.1 hypothetical protein CGCVW01_v008720 [Colletotrichum viniferum]KAF5525608.1 hypothetical protein CGCA056_v003763 [Colletotrichum aenigma]
MSRHQSAPAPRS